MADNFAPQLLSSPKTIQVLVLLYRLFRTSGGGRGRGEERQPGLTADKSRGSGAVDPRAGASLEGASPGAGGAGQGGVKRAGLGGSGCAQSGS